MSPILHALSILLLLDFTTAQGLLGKHLENHPRLETYRCTKAGCNQHTNYVVLDEGRHPIHQRRRPNLQCSKQGAPWNTSFCSNVALCTQECLIDGIGDYSSYGVATQGDSVKLDMLSSSGKKLSPRIYLLDSSKEQYEMLQLNNMEIAFDVDVSKLPCGMNGGMYLSEMDRHGGSSPFNKAGAQMGSGYCDAKCPVRPFINGVANTEGKGLCCNEMDLWESNRSGAQYTAHPCNLTSPSECSGSQCNTLCDTQGCGNNPWPNGAPRFYGFGSEFAVNTQKPFTVVTQFPADNGIVTSYRRYYIQDGQRIDPPVSSRDHLPNTNYIDDAYCAALGRQGYKGVGGTATMGAALARGMVLAMSIWWNDDPTNHMNWLDSGERGPCQPQEGDPKYIQRVHPDATITMSNIRWGEIGSTTVKAVTGVSPSSTFQLFIIHLIQVVSQVNIF
ncbi:Exoglucanase [Orbilia brochopaga]|nr:Exoglucanase [Drechslerella brochopaga]